MERRPFRFLSQQEFEKLSVEERMAYLHRAMADIREKLELTQQQSDALKDIDKHGGDS